MKITREFIEQHRTKKGGFTFAQCQALGAGWPPKKGWLKAAVLIDHSPEAVAMFVEFSERAATKPERRAERHARNARLRVSGITEFVARPQQTKRARKERVQPPPIPAVDPNGSDFLNSYAWRAIRMVALKQYGAKCMCCGATPASGAIINVDHIKPRKLFPWLALDVDNLQVLCDTCNHGKGNWDQTDWRAA